MSVYLYDYDKMHEAVKKHRLSKSWYLQENIDTFIFYPQQSSEEERENIREAFLVESGEYIHSCVSKLEPCWDAYTNEVTQMIVKLLRSKGVKVTKRNDGTYRVNFDFDFVSINDTEKKYMIRDGDYQLFHMGMGVSGIGFGSTTNEEVRLGRYPGEASTAWELESRMEQEKMAFMNEIQEMFERQQFWIEIAKEIEIKTFEIAKKYGLLS